MWPQYREGRRVEGCAVTRVCGNVRGAKDLSARPGQVTLFIIHGKSGRPQAQAQVKDYAMILRWGIGAERRVTHPRHQRTAVNEAAGRIAACQRHHRARNGLVAGAQRDAGVGHVALVHDLDAVGDPVPRDEAVAHAHRALRVAVLPGVGWSRGARSGVASSSQCDREHVGTRCPTKTHSSARASQCAMLHQS